MAFTTKGHSSTEDAPANLARSQPITNRLCSPVSGLQSGDASTWQLFCSKQLVPSQFPESPRSCRKGFRPPHSFLRSQAIWMLADKCLPAKMHGTWERRCSWTIGLRSPPAWALQRIPAPQAKATHSPITPCYLQPQKQPPTMPLTFRELCALGSSAMASLL